MKFNSLTYLVFLLVTLVAFYNLRYWGRVFALILASLVFYAFWNVPLIGLIIVQALIDFSAGRMIARTETRWVRRAWLLASLVGNLGILGFFKYANFFAENFAYLFGSDSAQTRILNIVLPPGISFYTFQSMSYTIDVFRGTLTATRSFPRFFLYIMFFPQLVAGPIERAGHLMTQLDHAATRSFRWSNFAVGCRMLIWGMFKKVMIADYCAILADRVYNDPAGHDGWGALVGTLAFTLQIYCDFSAYSEMAKGSARMFGVDLMQNFDQPYLSTDMSQFWRRWHISLSTWIRDYIYIPLGGSQVGRVRALFNLIITMFLSGLWHGAAWNYVLWGLYHGFLLLIQALVTKTRGFARIKGAGGAAWGCASWALTFSLVTIGWILFRIRHIDDFGVIMGRIGSIFTSFTAPTVMQAGFLGFTALFLVGSHLKRRFRLMDRIDEDGSASLLFYGALIVIMALYIRPEGPQFIYFQF